MTLEVRANDAAECRAAGLEPAEALAMSIARSDHAVNEFIGGEHAASWGWRLRGFLTQNIDAWLLTSDVVERNPIYFARQSRKRLKLLLEHHPSIFVEVHAAYTTSVKWLLWLGFRRVGERIVGGETFLIMQKDRGF